MRGQKPRQLLGYESRGLKRSKVQRACNVGDLGLIPGLGRSPGEGKGYPLQYSDLENSVNCIIHGVTQSRTRLSDFHFQRADEQAWDPRGGRYLGVAGGSLSTREGSGAEGINSGKRGGCGRDYGRGCKRNQVGLDQAE